MGNNGGNRIFRRMDKLATTMCGIIAWQEKRSHKKGPKVLLIPRGNPDLIWLLGDAARFLAFAAPESLWYVELPQEEPFSKAAAAAAKRYGYRISKEAQRFDVVLSLTPGMTSQQMQTCLSQQLAPFYQQRSVPPQQVEKRAS